MSKKKPHKTAETSIECYHALKKSGQIVREKELVLNAITLYQPITSRELGYKTGKERSNITRSVNDLVKANVIKHAFTDTCKTTKRRVQHYTLLAWQASETSLNESARKQ